MLRTVNCFNRIQPDGQDVLGEFSLGFSSAVLNILCCESDELTAFYFI